MWQRKDVKKNAFQTMKKNYWRILGISLLIAFIVGGMKVDSHLDRAVVHFAGDTMGGRLYATTNSDVINDWVFSTGSVVVEDGEAKVLTFFGNRYTPKKGVLAKVYNRVTEDRSVFYGILNSINNMAFKDRFGQGMIILAGVVLMAFFYVLIVNVLMVGQCRFVMENRCYPDSRFGRLMFPWRVRRWRQVSLIMLKKSIFQFLWDLTIIGGFIKNYSYKMIPYILAENPDIDHKSAFLLSRQMMNGNKFRTFVLDLSLIGWRLLNILTLGLLRWMFISPYVDMIYGELYYRLRKEAIGKGLPLASFLNDKALYVEPDQTVSSQYPVERHPLYREQTNRWMKVDYHRTYSVPSIILMFFSFSMIGWIWEVSLHLFGDGDFVNRGFFHGPWLPIYGAGGVLVLVLLKRLADKPLLLFLSATAVCGVVEYTVAWFLWETQHKYWWNYTGYFLNLQGRICAEGLIVFGLGGCAMVYLLAPLFDEIFRRIPRKTRLSLCVILTVIFVADAAYSMAVPNSGRGITDYDHHVEKHLPEKAKNENHT